MDLDAVIPVAASLCRVFGVRHLSPAAARHLEVVLDALQPTAVLVEGPADASAQIKHLVHKDTKPPLALLAYTKARPVRTILYPLAEYSPEWVALHLGPAAQGRHALHRSPRFCVPGVAPFRTSRTPATSLPRSGGERRRV